MTEKQLNRYLNGAMRKFPQDYVIPVFIGSWDDFRQ